MTIALSRLADWLVEDSGTDPLKITMSVASLTALAQESTALAWVRAVQPRTFQLGSGQYRDVAVVVRVPRGTPPGSYYVNVVASATGGGQLSAEVGGMLEVNVP